MHPSKDRGYDINYFVPNLGADHEILQNHNSLSVAEKQLGHKLGFPYGKEKKKPVEYATDLPLDEDIIATKKHLSSTEKQLGHKWTVTEVFKG